MQAKDHMQIAKILYAMEQKRRKPDIVDIMHNERYQRTFTDEYSFRRKPAAREPIPEEVRQQWAKLARRTA